MKIDGQNIDIFYDLIDEACMRYYEDIHLDYLDAFIRVTSDILEGLDDDIQSPTVHLLYNSLHFSTGIIFRFSHSKSKIFSTNFSY